MNGLLCVMTGPLYISFVVAMTATSTTAACQAFAQLVLLVCRLFLYPDMMYGYFPERLPATVADAEKRRGVRLEIGGMMRSVADTACGPVCLQPTPCMSDGAPLAPLACLMEHPLHPLHA